MRPSDRADLAVLTACVLVMFAFCVLVAWTSSLGWCTVHRHLASNQQIPEAICVWRRSYR